MEEGGCGEVMVKPEVRGKGTMTSSGAVGVYKWCECGMVVT